ncbi:MAG: PIG-L family deacetylase [Opitutales bacterium]|nr:PIG-L family deacetylase [Opitutales bacterium]
MQSYLDYVHSLLSAYDCAAAMKPELCPVPCNAEADAPCAIILSPHPDDEMIIGALPLRLMREAGMRVINIAVTLGSKKERQLERLAELRAACAHIGYECICAAERGLERITPESRDSDKEHWKKAVSAVASQIARYKPVAVFYPHASDANRTHMGVHSLAIDALKETALSVHCFETEFWSPLPKPNLMVESSTEDLATLMSALYLHKGEIERNPYHLLLPMWMMDNVRRGAEIVGTQGGDVPAFRFATLYRHLLWDGKRMEPASKAGVFLDKETAAKILIGDSSRSN